MLTAGKTVLQNLNVTTTFTYVLVHVCRVNKGTLFGFINIANILFLLCILSILVAGRNQLDFVGNQRMHPYRTCIYGYGLGGRKISYPRQPCPARAMKCELTS